MDLSRTFLVTHKSCEDGSACAILFIAAGGKRENIYFVNPSHNFTDEVTLDLLNSWPGQILLVDVSISLDLAESIGNPYCNVVLLDHHVSSKPLRKFSFCTINNNECCGSMMLYDWFLDGGVPTESICHFKELIKLVDDQDRWIHNYPESQDLAVLHRILGQELFIDRFLKKVYPVLTEPEKYLIDVYKKKRAEITKTRKKNVNIFTKEIDGHQVKFGFVIAPGDDQSWLGNSICSDFDMDVDIAVIINGEGISLRSSSDCPISVSKVAQLNGGGGHYRSAGCSLNDVLKEDFIELIVDRMCFK